MAQITLEKETNDLKEAFLHDLKVRGIPKDGTTFLVIFYEETRKKLIDFGFKLREETKSHYEINYPQKPKSIIKEFFEQEWK